MQIPKEQAKKQISQLIERFDDHINEYKRGSYNETQTRIDYINPFFKALGWDINNEQGLAEAYREVIHEYKLKTGGTTKAPDYCFTVYGQRKFFVDAKKPSINIKSDISPAYQVKRYGWSAKLSIAIVTDFEEFSIYDCSKKPNQNDKSSVARIQYLTYKDYLKEFDFIWETFSKERILKGSFDKYVQSGTKKRGTATVDNEFLKEIDEWRKYLATTIALRNATLSEDEINYAVQKTIDRIIFLRICEDRGVEQYGKLNNAIKKGDLYKNLFELFHIADEKYNSGLFDFKEDNITPNLIIDNKVIKNIIRELYYPHSPFEFSVLPADILGSVYEQFLGKTIRLTKAHQAKIEEKPEVRKAGGVYYTPKYIVDYIVENTVGKLLNGKTPKQAENINICDPACGSGSFLIGAYQYMLDWHLKYYIDNPLKNKKEGPVTPDGNLTTAEKKRILLNNIYGVDIDPQAVEVTKLNLLLKALEGETQASINKQLSFFNKRVLPNLGNNIKCGNSLISTDFYDNKLDLFPNQIKSINAFDWKEGFAEIFKQCGFDAVIGNPPYVAIDAINIEQREYFATKYPYLIKRFDLFGLFIDNGIRIIKGNGLLSYIIPMQFLKNSSFAPLRHSILKLNQINEINAVGPNVFEGANNDTIIFTLTKTKKSAEKIHICISEPGTNELTFNRKFTTSQSHFLKNNEYCFELISDSERRIIEKVEIGAKLVEDYFKVIQGIVTGLNVAFIFDKTELLKVDKKLLKDFLHGSGFDSYTLRPINYKILYLNKYIDINDFSLTKKHLLTHKDKLSKRREVKRNLIPWYSLQWPRQSSYFESPKIIFQKIRNQTLKRRLVGTYDDSGLYVGDGVIFLNSLTNNISQLKIALGILNSKLLNYYYKLKYLDINLKINYLINTAIPDLTRGTKQLVYIVKHVDNLLKLNKELQKTKLETQRNQLQRAIYHSESKIDELVYELYGLTKEEIEIIEHTI